MTEKIEDAMKEFRYMDSRQREVALFALLVEMYAAEHSITAAERVCERAIERALPEFPE